MDPFPHEDANHGIAHSYGYASDEPTNRLDPSGALDIGELGAVIAGFGALALVGEPTSAFAKEAGHASSPCHVVLGERPVDFWLNFSGVAEHLYIVFYDPNGVRTVFEGGPGADGKQILVGPKPYEQTKASPLDETRELLTTDGTQPDCGAKDCLTKAASDIQSAAAALHVIYNPRTGPNSNTVAVQMCKRCRLVPDVPVPWRAWGWDYPYFLAPPLP